MSNTRNAREAINEILGPMTIGMLITGSRTQKDWSVSELARQLGVSRQYISRVESGEKSISLEKALEIGAALNDHPTVIAKIWFEEQARKNNIDVSEIFKDESA
jgi:transcriptional regulator with XRE-family HTH domain